MGDRASGDQGSRAPTVGSCDRICLSLSQGALADECLERVCLGQFMRRVGGGVRRGMTRVERRVDGVDLSLRKRALADESVQGAAASVAAAGCVRHGGPGNCNEGSTECGGCGDDDLALNSHDESLLLDFLKYAQGHAKKRHARHQMQVRLRIVREDARPLDDHALSDVRRRVRGRSQPGPHHEQEAGACGPRSAALQWSRSCACRSGR